MEKKNFWKYVISFVMMLVMLTTMLTPLKAAAAEELYLAYQNTEKGVSVVKLKSAQRRAYRADAVYLNVGDKADLCFINASLWKNPVWTSSNNDVATVDSSGVITAVSNGIAKITLSYTKKITGKKVSASSIVYVGEPSWGIDLLLDMEPDANNFFWLREGKGVAVSLSGMPTGADAWAYDVVWESSNESIVRFENNKFIAGKSGTATLTAKIRNRITNVTLQKSVQLTVALTVQDKLNYLLDRLNVSKGKDTYFTVNQQACSTKRLSGHGCDNCSATAVIKTEWFRNIFGEVDVKHFPSHNVNATSRSYTGQSCFGFACFAQWYLFSDSASENLIGKCVATAKFNKAELINTVQPGDVIRVNGHSVVVYEVAEDGLWVVDCNANRDGRQLNCIVQKYAISYNSTYYSGHTAYINRVTKVDKMPIGAAGAFDCGKLISNQSSNNQEPTITPEADGKEKTYAVLDLSSKGWKSYNVGLNVDMYADKAYTIYNGAKLEVLGKYKNAKGIEICHVFSPDLNMECYITAKYVKVN